MPIRGAPNDFGLSHLGLIDDLRLPAVARPERPEEPDRSGFSRWNEVPTAALLLIKETGWTDSSRWLGSQTRAVLRRELPVCMRLGGRETQESGSLGGGEERKFDAPDPLGDSE